jgi:colicin import membrane protein
MLQLAPVLLLAIALSANATDFRDRTALAAQLDSGFEVTLANAEESLASAQAKLTTAQAELADAQANGGDVAAAQAKVDAAQADVDAAQAKVDTAQTQIGGATGLVDQMSDAQVFALNRALNNAAHNGLGPLAFDPALLQRIIDEDLGNREIQMLTQGVELRARFESNAARFDAKADASGDPKFADRADAKRDRGEALEGKFLARLDDPSADAADAAAEAARDAAREAAREAKHAAKEAAREAARDARGHGRP